MFDITHIFALIFVLTFNFVNGDQAIYDRGLATTESGYDSVILDRYKRCGCNVNGKMINTCLFDW